MNISRSRNTSTNMTKHDKAKHDKFSIAMILQSTDR